MVTYAFDFGLWAILFFIIGMIKPQWPLFFLKNPNRLMILAITTVFIMITFTLYGEGMRREKLEATKTAAPKSTDTNATPVPVPVPVPVPAQDKTTPAKKFL